MTQYLKLRSMGRSVPPHLLRVPKVERYGDARAETCAAKGARGRFSVGLCEGSCRTTVGAGAMSVRACWDGNGANGLPVVFCRTQDPAIDASPGTKRPGSADAPVGFSAPVGCLRCGRGIPKMMSDVTMMLTLHSPLDAASAAFPHRPPLLLHWWSPRGELVDHQWVTASVAMDVRGYDVAEFLFYRPHHVAAVGARLAREGRRSVPERDMLSKAGLSMTCSSGATGHDRATCASSDLRRALLENQVVRNARRVSADRNRSRPRSPPSRAPQRGHPSQHGYQ